MNDVKLGDPKKFGEEVKKFRKSKNMKMSDLADKIGVTQPYISQVENGKRGIPKYEMIKKIADALEIKSYLLISSAGYAVDDYIDEMDKKLEGVANQIKLNTLSNYVLNLDRLFNEVNPLTHKIDNFTYKGIPVTEKKKKQILTMLDVLFDIEGDED